MKSRVLLTALFVTGCASVGSVKDYRGSIESGKETLSESIPGTAFGKATNAAVSMDYRNEITPDDPMFLNLGFPSNYDIYRYSVASAGTYNIRIESLCKCLGFNKTLMFPSVRVFDGAFGELPLEKGRIGRGSETFSTLPEHLEGDWKVSLKGTGAYYVVFAPYNRNIGEPAFEISANFVTMAGGLAAFGTIGGIKLRVHPYGQYLIRMTRVDQ